MKPYRIIAALSLILVGCLLSACADGVASSAVQTSSMAVSTMAPESIAPTSSAVSVSSAIYSSIPSMTVGKAIARDYEYSAMGQEAYLLGEIDSKLLFYDKSIKAVLYYLNRDTLEITQRKMVSNGEEDYGAKIMGQRIFVRLNSRIVVLNFNLEIEQEITLPKVISEALDLDGGSLSRNGYDIAADLKTYCYNDLEGLKLLDSESGNVSLLAEPTVVHLPDDEVTKGYYFQPQFVNDDKQIVSTVFGYEGIDTCVLTELATAKSQDIPSGDVGTYRPAQNGFAGQWLNQPENNYGLFYFDIKNNHINKMAIKTAIKFGLILGVQWSYVGKNYAVVQTIDETEKVYSMHRINLKTMKVEENVITVKSNNNLSIHGVTDDGRIIFSLPKEAGLITVFISK